ncbi:hypothetical protein OAU81_00865 [bacterium]|nr:hypothetical protein [bacterium]
MSDSETNIKELLKKATNDLLTEDTLGAIEEAFKSAVQTRVDEQLDGKVSLHVEKALIEQDEQHATKLESLLEAIDTDHTSKLHKVLMAVNENHAEKLKLVAKRYKTALVAEANQFKGSLIDTVSKYLDTYLENVIPTQDIQEAVKNRKALDTLTEMRRFLGVDLAVGKASIKDAIVDGKKQIRESNEQKVELAEKNQQLNDQLISMQREKILNEKTSKLPAAKRNYINKVLGDKDIEFIKENFDYTLTMFEKTEEDRVETFKKQAVKAAPKVDRPTRQKVLNENNNSTKTSDPMGYMSELGKF